jgi:putative ABC transport system permease protein
VFVTAQFLEGSAWSPWLEMPRGMSRVLPGNDVWGVTEGFYRLLDFAPTQGRLPTDDELRVGAPLLVVSERIARAYWPGTSSIGQTLAGGFSKELFTVVGVVRDVPWFGWDLESPVIYGPYSRLARSGRQTFLVRTDRAANHVIDDALRAMVAADPMIRPTRALPLLDLFRETVSLRRFQSWLFGGFAMAALVVVGVGILGLLAMATARRTKEIGIRCALGATPHRVTRLLVQEQLWAVLAGLAVGGLMSAWAVGLVQTHVYRLSVGDPRIWGAAVALVLLTAGLGAFLPARRASHVDPLQALRAE